MYKRISSGSYQSVLPFITGSSDGFRFVNGILIKNNTPFQIFSYLDRWSTSKIVSQSTLNLGTSESILHIKESTVLYDVSLLITPEHRGHLATLDVLLKMNKVETDSVGQSVIAEAIKKEQHYIRENE